MKAAITGITGFVGGHLAEHLVDCGDEVVGFSRSGRWPDSRTKLAREPRVLTVDLDDEAAVRRLLRDERPDVLYHLAGQASVPESFAYPDATWRTNFVGARKLFDALLAESPATTTLVVSTGQVHGQPARSELPITESTPLRPVNPYAISKAAADLLALEYVAGRGAKLVIARPFNHIGPRQQETFAIAHFARQIAELERQAEPRVMHVGRLDVERDFTDVRDVVRAYRLLIEKGSPGEVFNVASGQTRSVKSLLEMLLAMSRVEIEVAKTDELLRPSDPDKIEVSCSRLRDRTGWTPLVPMQATLEDTLAEWRRRV